MADEQNTDQPPQWFDEFKNQLGNTLGGITAQQQQMASQMAQAAATPAPAPLPSKETDEKLLSDFVNNPSRFIKELDQVITKKATDHAEHVLRQQEEARRTEEAARQFENQFFSENAELLPYRAILVERMGAQPGHLDPKARADAAAAEVRELIKKEQLGAIENERRQRVSALRASGAQGFSAAVEEGDFASPQTELERKQSALDFEIQAQRKRVSG